MIPFPIISQYGNKAKGPAGIKKIEFLGGDYATILLTDTGNLYAKGNNTYGYLGTGNTNIVSTFILIDSGVIDFCFTQTGLIYITSSDVKGSGTAISTIFGINSNNSFVSLNSKFSTFTDKTLIKIQMANDICAVQYSNALYTVGTNTNGHLGTGNTTSRTVFGSVATSVQDFAIGSTVNLYYINTSGVVYGCGSGGNGSIDGGGQRNSFTQITTSCTKITRTNSSSLILYKNDGVYFIGYHNGYFGFSSGTATNTAGSIVKMNLPYTNDGTISSEIYVKEGIDSILKGNNLLYYSGRNTFGSGGYGNTNASRNYIAQTLPSGISSLVVNPASGTYISVIYNDSTLYYSGAGQMLGLSSNVTTYSPSGLFFT